MRCASHLDCMAWGAGRRCGAHAAGTAAARPPPGAQALCGRPAPGLQRQRHRSSPAARAGRPQQAAAAGSRRAGARGGRRRRPARHEAEEPQGKPPACCWMAVCLWSAGDAACSLAHVQRAWQRCPLHCAGAAARGLLQLLLHPSCQSAMPCCLLRTNLAKPYLLPSPQSAAKRYKITGSGKVMVRRAGKQHLNEKQSRKTKRNLG